ncbi:MAG: hypothetical protein IPK80_15875 [Nannocystis sp.]|nr:hypothetical protein [Nannocystis sp.]
MAVAQGGDELFEQGVFVAQGAAEIDDGLDQPLGVFEGPVREEGFVDRGSGFLFVEQGPLGIGDVGAHGLEEGRGLRRGGRGRGHAAGRACAATTGWRFPACLRIVSSMRSMRRAR